MDLRGRPCTLYPVSWQGTIFTTSFFVPPVEQWLYTGLVDGLRKLGLDPRQTVPGTPDLELVLRVRVVRADPGSRGLRWLLAFIAGAAVFQIEVLATIGATPVGSVFAQGKRRWGIYGGDSQDLLQDAAKLAGQHAMTPIAALLAYR